MCVWELGIGTEKRHIGMGLVHAHHKLGTFNHIQWCSVDWVWMGAGAHGMMNECQSMLASKLYRFMCNTVECLLFRSAMVPMVTLAHFSSVSLGPGTMCPCALLSVYLLGTLQGLVQPWGCCVAPSECDWRAQLTAPHWEPHRVCPTWRSRGDMYHKAATCECSWG